MSNQTTLKTLCPFCGSKLTTEFGSHYTWAHCEGCMAHIGWPSTIAHNQEELEFMITGRGQVPSRGEN